MERGRASGVITLSELCDISFICSSDSMAGNTSDEDWSTLTRSYNNGNGSLELTFTTIINRFIITVVDIIGTAVCIVCTRMDLSGDKRWVAGSHAVGDS